MQFKNNRIILDKELNNLDKFTLDFVEILEKHTSYVLVSGYVAILFGRSRISEDIDIFVPRLTKEKFKALNNELSNKFWCLNTEDKDELYDMLVTKHSIRFARKSKVIPNMELKFVNSEIDKETIENKIKVTIGKRYLFVSPIELQIAFKEIVLKSQKDMEDALHLREVFKDKISKEKIKYYEALIKKNE